MSKRDKKRNRPSTRPMKEKLFVIYGTVCMVCEKQFSKNQLQLHHIEKWEHTHTTTFEQSSLVCDTCHKDINYNERNNKKEYVRVNQQIRNYKATH